MSTLKPDVEELQHINIEIKRLSESLKSLRKTKATVEARIAEYLKEKDIPGVRHNGNAIIIKQNVRNVYNKPKTERNQELISLLRTSGVLDPADLIAKMKIIGREKVKKNTITIQEYRS